VLVIVPRFFTRLVRLGEYPVGDRVWSAMKPLANAGGSWRNIYTEEIVEGEVLELRHVFASFPFAVLQRA
jgi:(1->4)-alpha-D-glucan 1-alpha-D-glucosylmutase